MFSTEQTSLSSYSCWLVRETTQLLSNMVLLTMTETMVKAITFCDRKEVNLSHPYVNDGEPSLEAPAVGDPISHAQVLAISRCLRKKYETASHRPQLKSDHQISCQLDELLRGSKVYVEPPKPRTEPVSLTRCSLWYHVTNSNY